MATSLQRQGGFIPGYHVPIHKVHSTLFETSLQMATSVHQPGFAPGWPL